MQLENTLQHTHRKTKVMLQSNMHVCMQICLHIDAVQGYSLCINATMPQIWSSSVYCMYGTWEKKVSVLRPYVGTQIFIGTFVAAGIYARKFKFVRPYPYYARICTTSVSVLRPYPYYVRIRTTPVFVLRPYLLSIERGAKH